MDQLSTVFLALADPTRRAILADLALGPKPVGDIAKPFQMSEPGVIKHLKILERAGLVVTSRERQMRPRSLNAVPLEEAHAWVENYKRFWEPSFDRLEVLLRQLQNEDKHESP
jgi:DNA-binding transcriptional ArsR family regulator